MTPVISVIIPTRNRADLLSAALRSLTNQHLPAEHFEVLVVDNGSTDHTRVIVNDHSAILSNLRYCHEPEPGLHSGRHRGMQEAQGKILVFTDDDIEALPTWLSSIQEAFSDPDVAMVGGNNRPMFAAAPPPWLAELWGRTGYGGRRALPALSISELPDGIRDISPLHVWGCNLAIRREVLLQAGGFHPDGMPNELLRFRGDGEAHVTRYVAGKGLTCRFHSGASIYHKVTPERMTFAYFRQRGFNQGISDSYTELRGEVARRSARMTLPYRAARWGWGKFKALTGRLKTGEYRNALEELRTGHRSGYVYHQNAYLKDPEVREWVHRERYF